MTPDIQIDQIQQLVDNVLEAHPQYFSVLLKIKPTNNIKLFVDGDEGITIEKCISFNRQLRKMIEEAGWYPEGEYSLEVSSPGVDEPLKFQRQYPRNINRKVEVVLNDDTSKEGILKEVTATDIVIEHTEGKGKKAVTEQITIPFDNIKTTTVQISF